MRRAAGTFDAGVLLLSLIAAATSGLSAAAESLNCASTNGEPGPLKDSAAGLPASKAAPAAIAPGLSAQPPLVVLDPGHGGRDLGAAASGKREKDLALSISLKVREILKRETGRHVRLTRYHDIYIPLDQRVFSSQRWRGSVFVSLHINKAPNRSLSGITIYSYGRGSRRSSWRRRRSKLPHLPPPPRRQVREGAALAARLSRELRAAGFDVDPLEKAPFYVLKNPTIPSVLVELGFLSNAAESRRLSDPAYQERLAAAVARGISAYLGASGARPPSFAAR